MPEVTKDQIINAVRAAGIEPGDVIMVHSSLKSFGHVAGGAETVVDALIDAVGPEGTVVVPTLTATYAQSKGGSSGLAWNRDKTPSRVGLVTETLRRRPEARRSEHPTHSVAAIGDAAEEIVSGHWPASTFNIEGPYGKYVKAGAKIVFLGVFPTCNTTLHAVEDWLDLPYMAEATALIEKADGSTEEVKATKAPLGHRDFYSKAGRIHSMLEAAGVVKHGNLNGTEIRVMPARSVVGLTLAKELELPGVLLCERLDCDFCMKGREAVLTMQDEIREAAERLLDEGYAEKF